MDSPALFDIADRILALAREIRFADAASHEVITPLETSVMRYIDRHPGASARVVADASLLTSSNFSRALRNLESKGFVRREADPEDGRSVRLYPTERAAQNLRDIHDRWSDVLAGVLTDEDAARLAGLLAELEDGLTAQRVRAAPQNPPADPRGRRRST